MFSLVLPLLNTISMMQFHLHKGFTALYCQHGKRALNKLFHATTESEWPGEGHCCKGRASCQPKVLSANYVPQFLIFPLMQYWLTQVSFASF